eukprot:288898-Prymnesium_polylepis.1
MIAVRLSQGCGSAQIKPDKCKETTSASLGSRPFSLAAALSDSEKSDLRDLSSVSDGRDLFDPSRLLRPLLVPSPTVFKARDRLANLVAAYVKSYIPTTATVMMGTSRLRAVQISNSAAGSVASSLVSRTTTASL